MADEKPPGDDDSGTRGAKSEDKWAAQLTREQYEVLRNKGTERPFTGKYNDCKDNGVYRCAGCGNELFAADTKFDSGTGWPSFFRPLSAGAVHEETDTTHGMTRTEVMCAKCDGHLGHVFEDGPDPTGLRYCMNSLSLDLKTLDPKTKDK